MVSFKDASKIWKRSTRFNHFQHHLERKPKSAVCGNDPKSKCCLREVPVYFLCGGNHMADFQKIKVLEIGQTQELANQEEIPIQDIIKVIGASISYSETLKSGNPQMERQTA